MTMNTDKQQVFTKCRSHFAPIEANTNITYTQTYTQKNNKYKNHNNKNTNTITDLFFQI